MTIFEDGMQEQLEIPFFGPAVKQSGERRGFPPAAGGDASITCRRERIEKRNRVMTARYYYWTEIRRRRFDDVLRILSDNEFFVEERTISNALLAQDDFYRSLRDTKASPRDLRVMFPGFDWN